MIIICAGDDGSNLIHPSTGTRLGTQSIGPQFQTKLFPHEVVPQNGKNLRIREEK